MTNYNLFPKYQYEVNRTFSDKFERQIKRILGELFFVNDFHKDTKENTDLMLLKGQSFDVACRIRKYYYYERYPDDITIRGVSKNKKETEIHKLAKGFGKYMFYGFCDEEEKEIISYKIIDLDLFRYKMIVNDKIRKELFEPATINKDGTGFKVFKITMDDKLVIYSSEKNPDTLKPIF